jgi:NAD+ diphosphatase
MRDAEAVTFGGATFDRAAHLRADESARAALAAREDARCLAFWRNQPLLSASDEEGPVALAWLAPSHPIFKSSTEAPLFLGLDNGAPRFARILPDWSAAEPEARSGFSRVTIQHPELSTTHVFSELRAVMAELSHADAGNAATARGLFAWHEAHGFCARCGAPTAVDEAGWRRTCPDCGTHHFPRTDPVVIMLITRGNSVLLGRSRAWPEGMYSLLAGFMEPGETIEAAVRRETFEETGIRVGAVRYLASQPWPFPSSLMLGCRGEALDTAIRIDVNEIEDARWLTREEVMSALHGGPPGIRPARKGAIARFLIERWLGDRLD